MFAPRAPLRNPPPPSGKSPPPPSTSTTVSGVQSNPSVPPPPPRVPFPPNFAHPPPPHLPSPSLPSSSTSSYIAPPPFLQQDSSSASGYLPVRSALGQHEFPSAAHLQRVSNTINAKTSQAQNIKPATASMSNPNLRPSATQPPLPYSHFDIPPNQTIYCNNLNDKINKQELITCLYEFFIPFGDIISVHSKMGPEGRGQAFVVFDEISSATNALRSQQSKIFLDKPIRIQYSKSKSEIAMKKDGNYTPRLKKHTSEDTSKLASPEPPTSKPEVGGTLLVEDISPSITKSTLETLFAKYPGYIETRLIAGRGIAFIDFSSALTAEVAMDGLQNFKVSSTSSLKISFSK